MMGVRQRIVARQDLDRIAPEGLQAGAHEIVVAHISREHRAQREHDQWHGHRSGRLMDVRQGLLVGPRRAVEGHDQ